MRRKRRHRNSEEKAEGNREWATFHLRLGQRVYDWVRQSSNEAIFPAWVAEWFKETVLKLYLTITIWDRTEQNTSALVPQIWTGDELDGAKRNQALLSLSLSLFLHWPLSQPLFHRRSLTQTPFTCKFRRVTRPRSYSLFGAAEVDQKPTSVRRSEYESLLTFLALLTQQSLQIRSCLSPLFLLPSPFSYDYLEAKPPSFYSLKNFRRTRTERNAKWVARNTTRGGGVWITNPFVQLWLVFTWGKSTLQWEKSCTDIG